MKLQILIDMRLLWALSFAKDIYSLAERLLQVFNIGFLSMSMNIVFMSKMLALTSPYSLKDDIKLNRDIAAKQFEILGGKL